MNCCKVIAYKNSEPFLMCNLVLESHWGIWTGAMDAREEGVGIFFIMLFLQLKMHLPPALLSPSGGKTAMIQVTVIKPTWLVIKQPYREVFPLWGNCKGK